MARTFAATVDAAHARATLGETLGLLANVIGPILAQGVIIRRPNVLALAERLDLNRRAVRYVQQLRNKYGTGPLLLRTLDG